MKLGQSAWCITAAVWPSDGRTQDTGHRCWGAQRSTRTVSTIPQCASVCDTTPTPESHPWPPASSIHHLDLRSIVLVTRHLNAPGSLERGYQVRWWIDGDIHRGDVRTSCMAPSPVRLAIVKDPTPLSFPMPTCAIPNGTFTQIVDEHTHGRARRRRPRPESHGLPTSAWNVCEWASPSTRSPKPNAVSESVIGADRTPVREAHLCSHPVVTRDGVQGTPKTTNPQSTEAVRRGRVNRILRLLRTNGQGRT